MPYPLKASAPFAHGSAHPTPAMAGTFIPELWAPRLLVKFYEQTILRQIASFDFEQQFRNYGDTIHIRTVPDATVRPYEIGMSLQIEQLGSPKVTMSIDRGYYVAALIQDVYRVQSDINLTAMLIDEFTNKLRVAIERDVFAGIIGSPAATNMGNAAGAISGNVKLGATGSPLKVTLNPSAANDVDPIHLLLRLNQVLIEQNVPPDGRWWVVIPAWMAQLLKPSDLGKVDVTGDDRSPLRTGVLGQIDRLTVYVSNLLPTTMESGTKVTTIYAGHPYAINFATQLSQMEDYRSPETFGTIIRGLQIYGFKVTKPEALAKAYCYGSL